jgi:hypothetical protein
MPVRFRLAVGDTQGMNQNHRTSRGWSALAAGGAAVLLTLLLAVPAYAANSEITSVIDSIRNWIAGLLVALATLFLTLGGLRYLTANGNPRALEQAKDAIKSALVGYALAALAPLLVDVLRQVLKA